MLPEKSNKIRANLQLNFAWNFPQELETLKEIEQSMPCEVHPENFAPVVGYGVIDLVRMQNFPKN